MEKQVRCPHCGSPVSKLYNHKCEWCREFIDFNIKRTKEINPRYLYNVEIQDIMIEHRTRKIIIYTIGDYSEASEILEFTNNETCMRLNYEDFVPKKVRFAISFPIDEFYECMQSGNIRYILSRFPFNMDKDKLIEAIIKYRNKEFNRW